MDTAARPVDQWIKWRATTQEEYGAGLQTRPAVRTNSSLTGDGLRGILYRHYPNTTESTMTYRGIVCIVLVAALSPALAQEKAVTESGKKVIIYPDGTWKPDRPSADAKTRGTARLRAKNATAKMGFNRDRFTVYYDPAKWKSTPSDESGKVQLKHVNGDGMAMVIAERLQMSLDTLKNLALNNAKSAAPDVEIIFQETRRVNGTDVLVLQMKGTIQGIAFYYYGYYYAGSGGVIQVITYTGQNLFDEYKKDFDEFLDGLTVSN